MSAGSDNSHGALPNMTLLQPLKVPVLLPNTSGVSVVRGPEALYVQVRCRNRPSLLSDILAALDAQGLEVSNASMSTVSDGLVRGVFEVQAGDSSVSPEDLQNQVHEAIYDQQVRVPTKRR